MKGISKSQILNKSSGTVFLFLIFFIVATLKVSAFSTLSVSNVDFESNDPVLGGRAFLLTVVEDGSSQYAVGTISASQIQDNGYKAKNDLKIETNINEQSCDYSLSRSSEHNIYKIQYEKTSVYHYQADQQSDTAVQQCLNKNGYFSYFTASTSLFKRDLYCITHESIGVPGTIKTPTTNFKADISVTAHGEKKTGTLGSQTDKSVAISDVANARWSGNLVSGEQCPNLASEGYKVIHDTSGKWRMTTQSSYQNYISRKFNFDDRLDEIIFSSSPTPTQINNLVSALASNNLEADRAVSSIGYTKPVSVTSNSLSNGQMKLQLNKLIQFPVITMRVKADWLGIYLPVGEPKIEDISSSTFTEGTEGKIDVTIKNNGQVEASFTASASCQDPFRMLGTSTTTKISAGSTKQISIPVTVTTNEEISKTCTVTVHDVENPDKRDTATVTVKATPLAVCSPGQTRCEGETAQICNSAGSAYEQDINDALRCVDPTDPSKEQRAREECEKLGGKFVKKESNPPVWKFWEDTEITYQCRIPKTPVLALVSIIAGFAVLIWMISTGAINPPIVILVALLELIGWIWLLIGRAGLY